MAKTAAWYDALIEKIIDVEGGYVNNPSDHGGETKYGITTGVARENGYKGAMADMPIEFARRVYFLRYISVPKFDQVYIINPLIGRELTDTGVNMGPAVASVFFQRWLNAFNLRGKLYPDLFVDGRLGPQSLDAFRAYLVKRGTEGVDVMLAALNGVQCARYLDIAEHNQTQEDFIYGWIRARVLDSA